MMGGPERRSELHEQWTGQSARLLRTRALRLSVRDFAARLGIPYRTVSKWEQAGENRVPRPHMQAILDTALEQSDDAAKARFAQSLHPKDSNDDAHSSLSTVSVRAIDVDSSADEISPVADQFDSATDLSSLWIPGSTARDVRDF